MNEVKVGDLVRTFQAHEDWDEEANEEYVLDAGIYHVKRVMYQVLLEEWPIRLEEGEYAIVSERKHEVIEPTVTVPRDDLRKVLQRLEWGFDLHAVHDEANRLRTIVEST